MLTNRSVLVTVPDLVATSSPYREVMGMAKYIPRFGFKVGVCSLRVNGYDEASPLLRDMGVGAFVHRFRPRNRKMLSLRHYMTAKSISREASEPYSIQHSLDFTSSPYEAVLARVNTKYFVFTQRNMNLQGHVYALRMKIKLSHRIVGNSHVTADLVRGLGASEAKVSVIYNGLDLESVRFIEYSHRPVGCMVLSVGHIIRLKRHEDAIRAVAALVPEFPDLHLAVVGRVVDGQYASELRELVARLGLEARVEFLGARSDVIDLMKQAQAFILCSEAEAFGWVVVEAMASGIPVIAPDVGGPREIVGGSMAGWLVTPRDINGYRNAIAEILRESRRVELVTRNARQRVEKNFSAESMAMKLVGVYGSILNERHTHESD